MLQTASGITSLEGGHKEYWYMDARSLFNLLARGPLGTAITQTMWLLVLALRLALSCLLQGCKIFWKRLNSSFLVIWEWLGS